MVRPRYSQLVPCSLSGSHDAGYSDLTSLHSGAGVVVVMVVVVCGGWGRGCGGGGGDGCGGWWPAAGVAVVAVVPLQLLTSFMVIAKVCSVQVNYSVQGQFIPDLIMWSPCMCLCSCPCRSLGVRLRSFLHARSAAMQAFPNPEIKTPSHESARFDRLGSHSDRPCHGSLDFLGRGHRGKT